MRIHAAFAVFSVWFYRTSGVAHSDVAHFNSYVFDPGLCNDTECADVDSTGIVALLQKRFNVVQRQQSSQAFTRTDPNVRHDAKLSERLDSRHADCDEGGHWVNFTSLSSLGYKDMRCLDGTTSAGYYFRPASSPSSSKRWIFHLSGGGECDSKKNCDEWLNITVLTGAHPFNNDGTFLGNFLLGHRNADFGTWNAVVLPYCSGDAWTGTQTKRGTTLPGLQFSGHKIFETIIDHFSIAYSLGDSEKIILSGESIGGTAVWTHLDFVREKLPSVPSIVGCSFAGFLFPQSEGELQYTGVGSDHPQVPLTPVDAKRNYEMWSSFVPARCAEQMSESPWMCFFSSVMYKSLQAPVFLIQAQTDSVPMELHDGIPAWTLQNSSQQLSQIHAFEEVWKKALFLQAQGILNSRRDGVFSPACLTHTNFAASIDGVHASDAFANWYFNRSFRKLVDTCSGTNCNPTCLGPLESVYSTPYC